MLSRVAENIYWLARYLERAEGTARLVSTSSLLQLDLPMNVPLSWSSLVDILGGWPAFQAGGHVNDERGVTRYLISDGGNPGSIISCVRQARENARVTRDMLPSEAWEAINELYLYVRENASSLTSRRRRSSFLNRVILHALQISGIMHGSVTRGPGHQFMSLGRYLERADMTTRIIDVRYASLIPMDDALSAYGGVCWMNVLKSLSAYEMYRHDIHGRITGHEVTNYLIKGTEFPRAVAFTLNRARTCLQRLPNADGCIEKIGELRELLDATEFQGMSPENMHLFIDHLQEGLGAAHDEITRTYFRFRATA